MSSWSWSAAPLPIRTGREPRQPFEVVQDLLVQVGRAVDPVHDPQRARAVARAVGHALAHPDAEPRRLLAVAEPEQRVDRERGVPDPGAAVVPVALGGAADHPERMMPARGDGAMVRTCRTGRKLAA